MELPRRNRRNGPARPARGLFEDGPYEDGPYEDGPYEDGPYGDENHDGEPYQDYEYTGHQRHQPYKQSLFADQNYPGDGYEDPRYLDWDYRGYEERATGTGVGTAAVRAGSSWSSGLCSRWPARS